MITVIYFSIIAGIIVFFLARNIIRKNKNRNAQKKPENFSQSRISDYPCLDGIKRSNYFPF